MIEVKRPEGWPIVRPGLVMDHLGPVMVVYQDARLDDPGNDVHLTELARAIDERRNGTVRVGVLYDVPSIRIITPERRKQLTAMLDSRRDVLQKTTAAYVMATTSMAARGVLRGIFWLTPPPYPYSIAATPLEGFRYIATRVAGVDADALARDYAALLAAHGIRRERAREPRLRPHRLRVGERHRALVVFAASSRGPRSRERRPRRVRAHDVRGEPAP
jgi:hypothetical protein